MTTENPVSTEAQTLRALKELTGFKIVAEDGDIGKVYDFFLDDEFWTIRYLVVDTGNWLIGRKVLLSPSVIREMDFDDETFTVALTREQVESSPDIDTEKPVSRQREMELQQHYNWPAFWTTEGAWPSVAPIVPVPPPGMPPTKIEGDQHLRSLREMIGYRAEATDGDIGFVDDFLAEDETWTIRYLVVSTHKWIPGRKVLVSPQWLVGPISWESKKVKLFMTAESVRRSPEYDPKSQINRGYEIRLYEHYDRPKYWLSKSGRSSMRHSKKPRTSNFEQPRSRRGTRPQADPHTVHFEVTNPAARKVCLAGNFNDWQPERTEMVPLGGGKFEKDLTLPPGTYEYRIVVDGKWMPDPNADHTVINPFGERNSVLTVE